MDSRAKASDSGRFLTSREVAELTQMCEATVRTWIKSGRLYAVRTHAGRGGRYRIPKEALERFLGDNVA